MGNDYIFKICLLGYYGVGKTSLVYRWIENRFSKDFKSTLGVNLLKKKLTIDGNSISAQIWDLGGQDSYQNLRKLYIEGAQGALAVFDVTNRTSFSVLGDWISSFKNLRPDAPILLIGNKIDLEDLAVKEEEAKAFAAQKGMDIMFTSAKTGHQVEDAFQELIQKILKQLKE